MSQSFSRCSCQQKPLGMDMKSCVNTGFLMIGSINYILIEDPNAPRTSTQVIENQDLSIEGSRIASTALDYPNDVIYFIDDALNNIKKIFRNGTGSQVVTFCKLVI